MSDGPGLTEVGPGVSSSPTVNMKNEDYPLMALFDDLVKNGPGYAAKGLVKAANFVASAGAAAVNKVQDLGASAIQGAQNFASNSFQPAKSPEVSGPALAKGVKMDSGPSSQGQAGPAISENKELVANHHVETGTTVAPSFTPTTAAVMQNKAQGLGC
jgi:hypothetical protein